MRPFFLTIVCIFLFGSVRSQEIHFFKDRINFGFVHEGEVVMMEFPFENKGNAPLVISDYQVECGCTVMEKPTEPILPGQKSILKVSFDTHSKYDRQDRTVTVISNALNSPTTISFKGVVLKPKKKQG